MASKNFSDEFLTVYGALQCKPDVDVVERCDVIGRRVLSGHLLRRWSSVLGHAHRTKVVLHFPAKVDHIQVIDHFDVVVAHHGVL